MNITHIELFKLLKAKIGAETAENLITFIGNEIEDKTDSKAIATKTDIKEVTSDINNLRIEVERLPNKLTARISALIGIGIIVFKLLQHFGI